jgi:hypothetical protein
VGGIAGGVVGGLVGLGLIAVAAVLLLRRRRNNRRPPSSLVQYGPDGMTPTFYGPSTTFTTPTPKLYVGGPFDFPAHYTYMAGRTPRTQLPSHLALRCLLIRQTLLPVSMDIRRHSCMEDILVLQRFNAHVCSSYDFVYDSCAGAS